MAAHLLRREMARATIVASDIFAFSRTTWQPGTGRTIGRLLAAGLTAAPFLSQEETASG